MSFSLFPFARNICDVTTCLCRYLVLRGTALEQYAKGEDSVRHGNSQWRIDNAVIDTAVWHRLVYKLLPTRIGIQAPILLIAHAKISACTMYRNVLGGGENVHRDVYVLFGSSSTSFCSGHSCFSCSQYVSHTQFDRAMCDTSRCTWCKVRCH